MSRRLYLVSFFLLGQAAAMPALTGRPIPTHNLAATPGAHLTARQTDNTNIFDPTDLSWINKLAAIGDSYSAGIGAGDRLGSVFDALNSQGDWACSRYDHSYPYLVNTDERLGDPETRDFQFKSCSGAVTKDVLENQIPSIDLDQQVILLSAGGNDVELSNILNQCIYQWAVVSQEQVAIAKLAALDENYAWAESFDWEVLGRGCEAQLDHSQSLIDSDTFSGSIDAVLDAAKEKLAEDGMIYYTGYGKFFGEDLSPECDEVSWSTWIYKTWNLEEPQAMLTADNRRRMNELVDAANAKLEAAVERAGSSVKFINYDQYIGEFGGRYCEPGVDESTTESNTRLMFYELNTWDPLGETPWKRSNGDPLNGTFEGTINILAEITLLVDPEAKLAHEDSIDEDATTAEIFAGMSANLDSSEDVQVPNLLPDGYGRVFHPQILLHEIIANLVIYNMANDHGKRNSYPEIPEVHSLDTCPFTNPLCGSSSSCENGDPISMGEAECTGGTPSRTFDPDKFEEAVSFVCEIFDDQRYKTPDDTGLTYLFKTFDDGEAPYWFNIAWEAGCTLPGDDTEQKQQMGDPLGDGSHDCETVFKDDIFDSCDNHGMGGTISAGCLTYKYQFRPSPDSNPPGLKTFL